MTHLFDLKWLKVVAFAYIMILMKITNATEPCKILKIQRLLTMDCASRALKEIPTNMQTDVEVLDLSENKIRHVRNGSFNWCPSLKILYLSENAIYDIEAGAFSSLKNLGVLDLSINVLREVPLNLPSSLYKLYLAENPLQTIDIKAITSLTSLSLADCSITTERLASLGTIPNLVELNITYNPITELTPMHLASFCQLKILHVGGKDPILQRPEELCSCLKLDEWAKLRGMTVNGLKCRYDKSITMMECNTKPTNATMKKYDECLKEWSSRNRLFWIATIGGVAVGIVLAILVYFLLRRFVRAEKQRTIELEANSQMTPLA